MTKRDEIFHEAAVCRFFLKVDVTDGCWNWLAATNSGYGVFLPGVPAPRRLIRAHRFSYELITGEIPAGLTIDHLCRNRACVNPDHMEPVTRGVNTVRGETVSGINSRKSECSKGHPLVAEYQPGEHRRCNTCHSENAQRWRDSHPGRDAEIAHAYRERHPDRVARTIQERNRKRQEALRKQREANDARREMMK